MSSAETGLRLREQDLTGKVALVTGSSRGIGRAITLNLASRGCSVLGTCSKKDSLHLIDAISHSISGIYRGSSSQAPKIISLVADILDGTAPYTICQALERQFDSHIDIYVNSAAMLESATMGQLTDEHIQNYMTGNLEFPVKVVNEFVKRKLFRKNSRIIMISSLRGRMGWGKQTMYGATKSAAESLARSWADAFGGKDPEFEFMSGTTANSIMVGLTDTDAMRNLPEGPRNQLINEMTKKQCLPRAGQPEDVADVVGLLCREESRWMTGAAIPADGGAHQIL